MDRSEDNPVEQLLRHARAVDSPAERTATVSVASRFARRVAEWRDCALALAPDIQNIEHPEFRRAALEAAAGIPLMSVRSKLRAIADAPNDPDREWMAQVLAEAADPSRIDDLLRRVPLDRGASFRLLAAMPLESYVGVDAIPELPVDAEPYAELWRAIALARFGEFGPLDSLLTRPIELPPLLTDEWHVLQGGLAKLRPIPVAMREHLVKMLASDDRLSAFGSEIAFALTWIDRPPGRDERSHIYTLSFDVNAELNALIQESDSKRRLTILNRLGWAAAISPQPPIEDEDADAVPQSDPFGRFLMEETPVAAAAATVQDNRVVNVQNWYEDLRRDTFVAGAKNMLRCWIGLPEPEHAAGTTRIRNEPIPPQGLKLDVQLMYNGVCVDRNEIRLPPGRTARSEDCDLTLQLDPDTRTVTAHIAFLYKGRIFELMQVEGVAVPVNEKPDPNLRLTASLDVSRRQTLDLPGANEWQSAWVVSDPSDPGKTTAQALVFGEITGALELPDGSAAVKVLYQRIFALETLLVRRNARRKPAQAAEQSIAADPAQSPAAGAQLPETSQMLDANDEDVRELFITMARHGALLYNQLNEQGYGKLGERIQVTTIGTRSEVPIEFVYDRGHPVKDATFCDSWYEALMSDASQCPTCHAKELTAQERGYANKVCPLGFWALQKILERHAPISLTKDPAHAINAAAPTTRVASLPRIKSAVFASSDLVPEDERNTTYDALKKATSYALLARNWPEWLKHVDNHPPLLLVMPHHGVSKDGIDFLQIGSADLEEQLGQLSRSQLTLEYINPGRQVPGPIVVMLGCSTGVGTAEGFGALTRRIHQQQAAIVVGTLAEVLGRHAAPVARELVDQLTQQNDGSRDFGFIMRRVRRRMLARGYLMALNLVAFGDAEWRLAGKAG